MATQTQNNPVSIQQDMLRQRMPYVLFGVIFVVAVLFLRIIQFQFPQDPRVEREFALARQANAGRVERFESDRGRIYDRDGEPLAVNTREFRIGISPNLVSDPQQTANDLARILNLDPLELFTSIRDSNESYIYLATVDPDTWREIDALGLNLAIREERIQQRFYPQGTLACQILGFVGGVGEDAQGYLGVEGRYDGELAGGITDEEVSSLPFGVPEDLSALVGPGMDLVLTIDRDIQFLVERELLTAVESTGSTGGSIIVMDPNSGDVLGMASYPSFDCNAYAEVSDQSLLVNPAVSNAYEPGSAFKVVTVAAALQSGIISPDWTYFDEGRLDIGTDPVLNWDRNAYGLTNLTGVVVNSLNVGTATIALEMGWESFYTMLDEFGMGQLTQVDLQGEAEGSLRVPGDSLWSESDLARNSFGQAISVTPLQMLTAVNAIANDGVMMRPRVVSQIVEDGAVTDVSIRPLRTPISTANANLVTRMMVEAVEVGLDESARLPGYTVAGKTGTAEIPFALGYRNDAWIMTFVGFLPADDPVVSVIIKLDEPTSGRWASQVAAPVFRSLAERLVVLMEIPDDNVRRSLAAGG